MWTSGMHHIVELNKLHSFSPTQHSLFFFHSRAVHLDIIEVIYLPIDVQENCFKNNIKIYITTAPTCFGASTIIRERIFELAEVTVIKIIN
jgi:hypothetical protein